MTLQFHPFVIPLFFSSLVLIAFAWIARQHLETLAVRFFLLVMLSVAGLNSAYAFELLSTDLAAILFWVKVEFFFLYLTGLWVFFILAYTGQEHWLTRRTVLIVFLPSTLYTLLAWTNELHFLNWATVGVATVDGFVLFDRTYGVGFYLGAGYLYLLILVAAAIMIRAIIRTPSLYRGQIGWLLLAVAFPAVGSTLTISGLSPFPRLDLMPLGYALACMPIAWSLFRHRLLDIVPLALGQMIDGMADPVLTLDTQQRIVHINPAAVRRLGYSEASYVLNLPLETALADRYADVRCVFDLAKPCHEVAWGGATTNRYFEVQLSPLHSQHGELRGMVLVLHDITARKQASDTIQRYAQELETRNRELDAFSHTVAHDLKTPLTHLIAASHVLLLKVDKGLLTEADLRAEMKRIGYTGQKMAAMVDGILLLSSLRTAEIIFTPVDTYTVACSARDRHQPDIDGKRIEIAIADDLPTITSQPIWLEEVFANLISNAIKYIGDTNVSGQIAIRSAPGAACVRFEVEDNGVGIDATHQQALFEMFSRFHEEAADGLGLGLSIVLRIVGKLGGEVGVDSQVGVGSTFWFTLPAPDEAN